MKVNILGQDYEIFYVIEEEMCELMLSPGFGGCCGPDSKRIHISEMNHCAEPKEVIELHKKLSLRHEIVHAFLNESGLMASGHESICWSQDEEIVDWFAIQAPKIFKAFQEVDVL